MSRLASFAAVALAVALAAPTARTEDGKPPAGFTALFDGKTLNGWKGHTTMTERAKKKPEDLSKLQLERTNTAYDHWKVENGVIHCDGKGGVSLVTDKDYGDIELMVDWKIEKGGDSGLYLRGQPQVQIWDSDISFGGDLNDKGTGSGGLWNNKPAGSKGQKPLKRADKPVGEWNTFHIKMVGENVTVKLNGELVVDNVKLQNYWEAGQPLPEKGPVELQFHNDPLWFKNIYIKELTK